MLASIIIVYGLVNLVLHAIKLHQQYIVVMIILNPGNVCPTLFNNVTVLIPVFHIFNDQCF